MTESKIKYFTPDEARKTLPLVKQIVRDILNKGYEIKQITDKISGPIEINSTLTNLLDQVESYINELKELGCYYKDWNFTIGLVDFPSIIDGEEVYLCWRSDEDGITYYHSTSDGYSGRKKLPDEYIIQETNFS
ncbi:DUF2203 domain-containing protein [Bacteroidota bacterium]